MKAGTITFTKDKNEEVVKIKGKVDLVILRRHVKCPHCKGNLLTKQ
jgi:hypothetical protein